MHYFVGVFLTWPIFIGLIYGRFITTINPIVILVMFTNFAMERGPHIVAEKNSPFP